MTPDAGYPALHTMSTIKATPRFSFSRAGLNKPSPRSSPPNTDPISSRAVARSSTARSPVPGPGAYHSTDTFRRGSPSWSTPFGSSSSTGRLEAMNHMQPGPGAYDFADFNRLSTRRATCGAIFGSSARIISPLPPDMTRSSSSSFCGNSPSSVGPGSYSVPAAPARGATFSRSPRMEQARSISPGPGSYEARPASPRKEVSVPFGKAEARPSLASACRQLIGCPTSGSGLQSPGPGSYNLEQAAAAIAKKPKAVTIHQRFKERQEISPGPGHYGGNYTMFTTCR